jgi:outer membrane protein assembly factor BamB
METTSRKPLRVWPGVALVILQWLLNLVPVVAPHALIFEVPLAVIAVLGSALCAVGIVVWWLFFSRAVWVERIGAIVLIVVAVLLNYRIVHESIAGGMMGMMLVAYSIPTLSLALVAWAAATRGLADRPRRALLVAAVVLGCMPWMLVRTGGISGSGSEFHWRWTKTPEQELLAREKEDPKPPPPPPIATQTPKAPDDSGAMTPLAPPSPRPEDKRAAASSEKEPNKPAKETPTAEAPARAATESPAEWPGFRGPNRDGVVHGVRIGTDWSSSAPAQIWRRPVGPGWSSFAVRGDLVYTQEQRGEDEVVSCYRVSTGEPVWRHRDPVRFYESNAGAGPRATPTVSGGRVYTMGATGVVNALDARTGAVIWSRNAAMDTKKEIPDWGLASSPLVIDDLVIIAASGHLVAYEIATGKPRWFGPTGGGGYSSPHFATINGVPQVLLLRGSRTISLAPADGTLLWDYTWEPGVSIVQPAILENGDVVVGAGDAMGGNGLRRLSVSRGGNGWTVQERWTSRGLKPYFNDFVIHKGHAYGFDGSILACIDLNDGARKWKGGRYGNGQLILLADDDLLLVLSEDGELALVKAAPDQFSELARMPALEGKTWNHPVVVRDVLLVRNGQEMAAFRLPVEGR